MEIEIEILRPVNPTGVSFIKYVYGAVASKNRKVIDSYKREFTRLVTRFGYAVEEAVGSDKMITGTVVLELDENSKPIRIYSKSLKIWEPTKEVKEKIEAKNE